MLRKLALLALLFSPSGVSAQSPATATFTPLNGATGVKAGESINLAVKVVLPEGLHAQSDKPKDESLIATSLTFERAAGATPIELVFPAAQEFKLETGDVLLVFEREFVIGVQVRVWPDQKPGPITINGKLRYQPCNNLLCFRPTTTPISWTFDVVPASSVVTALDSSIFDKIAWGTGGVPGLSAEASAKAGAPTPVAEPIIPTQSVNVDALDEFELRGTAGGYMGADAFMSFIRNAENGVKPAGMFEGRGPLAILLIVFLGGLALNLTPCVLPMIPVNLAIIGAGAQNGDKRRGFLLGLTYGAAMALVYGVIGLVVILTAGSFGTINSSPWFNGGIAVLFVVLGLAMFDIGAVDFSKWSSRFQFSRMSRGSFALAFGMGAVAAFLAGACVAPVVIQVVIFASDLYAKGSSIALALPFVLGLGMALPWPIAGAGLSRLPKPGAWMNRVKYAFGVFILATAAYYGYLTYEIVSNRWVNTADVEASTAEKLKEGWYSSLDDGLRAAKASGQPVLIDMWATWCKNCLTMDKTTLADPAVKAALGNYVKIKFQAEDLDAPAVKALMQRFNAVGLPAYAIVKSR